MLSNLFSVVVGLVAYTETVKSIFQSELAYLAKRLRPSECEELGKIFKSPILNGHCFHGLLDLRNLYSTRFGLKADQKFVQHLSCALEKLGLMELSVYVYGTKIRRTVILSKLISKRIYEANQVALQARLSPSRDMVENRNYLNRPSQDSELYMVFSIVCILTGIFVALVVMKTVGESLRPMEEYID